MQRDDSFLIKNARIFVGDGRVIESGSVLVRHGRIDEERVHELMIVRPQLAGRELDDVASCGTRRRSIVR